MADPTDLSPDDPDLWYKLSKPGSLGHKSIEDAAAAAEYHFSKFSNLKQQEHATIIYRDTRDGKIYHTPIVGSGENATVPLSKVWDNLPKEFTPLAVMHNHPADPKEYPGIENRLSDKDTGLGQKKNVRMFLIPPDGPLSEGTGTMRPYSFQDQRTKQWGKHDFQTVDPTLAEIPIDEIKQHVVDNIRANQNIPTVYKVNILRKLLDVPQTAQNGLMGQPMEPQQ